MKNKEYIDRFLVRQKENVIETFVDTLIDSVYEYIWTSLFSKNTGWS